MKKLILLAVMGLFISATAFAEAVVLQDGKTTSYSQGSSIMVNGKTTTRVLYDGILITVPQGQKVQISKAKDGSILVQGKNIEGVEVAGEVLSAKGQVTFSVSPKTQKITNITSVGVENKVQTDANKKQAKKQNKSTVKKDNSKTANTSKPAVTAAPVVDFPTASEYVNEVVSQQTAQDVERTETSPSSVTGN